MTLLAPEARTNEEARVRLYDTEAEPTRPESVTPDTPLGHLRLNWTERQLPERTRTKHVHRLHPYLGKYIPQLVEVFLRKYFRPGLTVIDPFAGSGTTLVQANEHDIHAVGCDISEFNILIGTVKTRQYDLPLLQREVHDILDETRRRTQTTAHSLFNGASPAETNGSTNGSLLLTGTPYLEQWFAEAARRELLTFRELIEFYENKDFLRLVLCRAARSARLTTHFDLDFPKRPTTEPYSCYKHSRICQPTKTAFKFLNRYALDGLRRVTSYAQLRTPAEVSLVHGDSRSVEFPAANGVITSPPYVGLIDYHEQHRYAYELLGLEDNSPKEIGPASSGQSRKAKACYVEDMKAVFRNVSRSLLPGSPLVVVAGDNHNLYPDILGDLGLRHEETLKRHVNRRTGRRGTEFYESIFIYTKERAG